MIPVKIEATDNQRWRVILPTTTLVVDTEDRAHHLAAMANGIHWTQASRERDELSRAETPPDGIHRC